MIASSFILFFLIVLMFPLPSQAQTTLFLEVQETVGLDFTHSVDGTCPNPPIGSGSAWADYDNDGDIDFAVTSMGGPNKLYQNVGDNNGDGLPDFVDVAVAAGVLLDNWTAGIVFVDYDNDGDQDLYITRWGGNYLFQNQLVENGSAVFLDVTDIAGVRDSGRAATTAWGDFDADGWIDFYIAKHFNCMPNSRESRDALMRNNGDGTFENVSQYLCEDGGLLCDQLNLGHAFTAAWFDYDNDGDSDIYLANDVVAAGYPNILWRNDGSDGVGGWVFTDVSAESGTDLSISGMGLGIGDYDNDGWMDIASGNAAGGYLLKNTGQGTFEDVSTDAGVKHLYTPGGNVAVVWSTPFFDYDNDQWLDLFYACGMIGSSPIDQEDALFHNNHDGTFTDVSAESGADDPRRGRSASICDFDQDGFVDLFVGNFGLPADLYRNQSASEGNTNHWLTVTAEGGGSVNRDGIGTRFVLTTSDGVSQLREITSGPTHGGGDYKAAYFGLGEHASGMLTVHWPDGQVWDLGDVSADQRLHISRTTGVSTPEQIAQEFELSQNHPNPFNPSTEMNVRLANSGHVTLKVYDLLGREADVLLDGHREAGHHTIRWDATGFPSGVYLCRLSVRANGTGAGEFVQTRKLVLLK